MTIFGTIKRVHKFLSQNLFYPIALGTLLVFTFYFGRVWISRDFLFKNLIWNLFLAWLPYLFSLSMAAFHRQKPSWWWALVIPGGLWLVFLPNSFYIVTDLIHVSQRQSIPIWYDAGLIAITAWTGIFLAVTSLHSVQGVVRSYLGHTLGWAFALIVIGISGYGVYLGRFLRWNSWDLLLEPTEILSDTLSPLLQPLTYADKIGFMVMYTSLYLVTYLTFSWLRPFATSKESMRIFIAGVMQGSNKSKGISSQDYRQLIRTSIHQVHPNAEIIDPFTLFPNSPEFDDQRAHQVLHEMAKTAGGSDIVITYLPVASMGTALEMIRAFDNGVPVITISPMAENWVIRSLSQHVFPTLEEFNTWVFDGGLETL